MIIIKKELSDEIQPDLNSSSYISNCSILRTEVSSVLDFYRVIVVDGEKVVKDVIRLKVEK